MESDYLNGILLILSAQTLALISPGPTVLAIMSTALERGRITGIAMAFGVAFGSMIWAALALFGVSGIVTNFPILMTGLMAFGGLFFVYLGVKSLLGLRNSIGEADAIALGRMPLPRYAMRGFLIQTGNPKVIFIWISLGMLGISGAPIWVTGLTVVLALCNSMLINGIYAVIFSNRWMMAQYLRLQKPIKIGFGVVFIAIGARFLAKMMLG